jgi:hypothetical protein
LSSRHWPLHAAPMLAALSLALAATPAHAATTCDRVAAPSGSDAAAGTQSAPYATPQKLADSLSAGQTGCLRAGTYRQASGRPYLLRVSRGGAAGSPLTIRSFPGERAQLRGVVYVPSGSDEVTLKQLNIVGTDDDSNAATFPISIQIMARNTQVIGSDITNEHRGTCMILGSNSGWGAASGTKVQGNLFHDCGDPVHRNLDHAIYLQNVQDADVSENVFTGNQAYAIHMYPSARRVRVHHNVMDRNGGGVIFAGAGSLASVDNIVERNVITGSFTDYNVSYYWQDAVGTGNVARDNCISGGRGVMPSSPRGFTASGTLVADPQYTNAGARDYRMASGSPCLALVGHDIATRQKAMMADAAAAPTPPPPPVLPSPTDAAPKLSIAYPKPGAELTSWLPIRPVASDDVGIREVQFRVGNKLIGTDTTAPFKLDYKLPADLPFATASYYTVTAVDTAGHSTARTSWFTRIGL